MRDTSAGAITSRAGGLRLRVRLTPKSARDGIEGEEWLSDGSAVMVVRVRAVPANGQANMALETLLAKAAGVARTRVAVVCGATPRIKVVELEGDPAELAARFRRSMSETIDRTQP